MKLIYAVATNALVNQHANVNRTARILADESKVEFLVVQDNFLTPTARFADVVLPACTQFETWGVEDGWKYGDEVILMPKVVEPPGECRSDYRICARPRAGASASRRPSPRGATSGAGWSGSSTATGRRASPTCRRSTSSSRRTSASGRSR